MRNLYVCEAIAGRQLCFCAQILARWVNALAPKDIGDKATLESEAVYNRAQQSDVFRFDVISQNDHEIRRLCHGASLMANDQGVRREASGTTAGLAISAKVNAEMAKRPKYDDPMASDQAQSELFEFVIYANELPAVADFLHEFLKLGAPVMICDIDRLMTDRAGKPVFTYHINDAVKSVLEACRTGNFVNAYLCKVNCHDDSLDMANVCGRIPVPGTLNNQSPFLALPIALNPTTPHPCQTEGHL